MSIYLGYPSALEYLHATASRRGARFAVLDDGLEDAITTAAAVRAAGLVEGGCASPGRCPTLRAPVVLLSSSGRGGSRSPLIVRRTWSKAVPPRSLCARMDETCVVASTPGFCLLQASSTLAFDDLMQLVLELCGTYSTGPRSVDETCGLTPLTTTSSLMAYLSGAGNGRAVSRARRAVTLAADRIGSPMEGVTYLTLCLPARLGGYGLPRACANGRINIPSALRRYYDSPYVIPDLCWRQAKVVVEYDSDEHHTGGERASRDSARRTLLLSLGYDVHVVNMSLLKDERKVDLLARSIAAGLGVRLRKEGPAVLARRRELRARILNRTRDWKHARGEASRPAGASRQGGGAKPGVRESITHPCQ